MAALRSDRLTQKRWELSLTFPPWEAEYFEALWISKGYPPEHEAYWRGGEDGAVSMDDAAVQKRNLHCSDIQAAQSQRGRESWGSSPQG